MAVNYDEAVKALEAVEASIKAKTAAHEEQIRKLEVKMNRQALGLGGSATDPGTAGAWSSTTEGKAFVSYLRTGEHETKAMSLGSDPDGGYAAPPQFADQIMIVGAEQGSIRNLARRFTPKTADFHMPISPTLAGAGRTAETTTRANTTTPGLAKWNPASGGIYAVAPVSNWLLNDAGYDIAAFVQESIGQQFGVTESADFVTGDGVDKSRGFTTYTLAATADTTRTWGQIEKLHAGSTSGLTIDNLIDLKAKLAPRYQRRAAWVMHPDTEAAIRKLRATTGGEFLWQPAVAAGSPNTLLGLPCFVDVNMPVIASAAATVALADWQRFYGVVDVGDTMVLRDPYTSKGHTLFYVEKRVGGGVMDFNAGKLLVMSV